MRNVILIMVVTVSLILTGCERPTGLNQTDNGIPPAVPSGLTLYSATDGLVILYWQANNESDLQGYNIYRSTDSLNYKMIGTTHYTSYYDDSLSYDSTYYYEISAVDIWGRESKKSSPVFGKPINRYTPRAPRNLSINARNWQGNLSVFIGWDASLDTDVKFYKIFRSTEPDFTPDSTNLENTTSQIFFSDTSNLDLYQTYYYKIESVDKGNLTGGPSQQISDQIFGIPHVIYPANNSQTPYFQYFILKAIKKPATYRIIVQNNKFFGSVWEKEFSTSQVNDTLYINFSSPYIYANEQYYWRIATFSNGSSTPNSVSPLYKFIIKQ